MPNTNPLDDKMILATLALIPISIGVSVATWDAQSPAVTLATPVVAAFIAIFTALDLKRVRRVAWGCLALQLTVLVIFAVATRL